MGMLPVAPPWLSSKIVHNLCWASFHIFFHENIILPLECEYLRHMHVAFQKIKWELLLLDIVLRDEPLLQYMCILQTDRQSFQVK